MSRLTLHPRHSECASLSLAAHADQDSQRAGTWCVCCFHSGHECPGAALSLEPSRVGTAGAPPPSAGPTGRLGHSDH